MRIKRLILIVAALAAFLALAVPAGALADGDPGSDELIYQNLYIGPTDGVSTSQQLKLGKLLYATQALGAQVRVAIIAKQADLGFVTALWRNPDEYSWYLGKELELSYNGRLVVVMPNGVAYWFYGHTNGKETGEPLSVPTGSSPTQLVNAATAAVTQLEASAGISANRLQAMAASKNVVAIARSKAGGHSEGAVASTEATAAGSGPQAAPSATDVSPVIVVVGMIVVLGGVFWVPPVWRRRRRLTQYGIGVPGLAVGVAALAALAILAIVVHNGGSSTGQNASETLALNPDIATPTSLGNYQKAANFTLTDETGQKVSLSQYRGKVVILSFTDDECQTICPVTTQAMVDARDAMGAAKKDVVLLGVNANAHSTTIDDVLSYTQLHGLLGQWHFLTGTPDQLNRVWEAYHVADDLRSSSNLIEHTPAIYMIGPNGNVRASFLTISNYASIPQFGQVMATEASQLLPSHPKLATHYDYKQIKGISPTTATTLPLVGGGRVTVGSGKHVYMFFDSWDQQSTEIKADMPLLDEYQSYAKAHGLPTLIAVDEEAVEPNPEAVVTFLKGMKLNYPVAVDATGQLADGYGVQGEPWFVLTVPKAQNTEEDPTATTPWVQEVYTEGWPSLRTLETSIPAALHPVRLNSTSAEVKRDLAGSPPALVALHQQASRLLGGGEAALEARIRALKGHPIVINIWASDCGPCQSEFGYFGAESAQYGARVAFLGIDYNENSSADGRGFLSRHRVLYPSYGVGSAGVPASLLPGGVAATPTTIYVNAKGKVVGTHPGTYQSAAAIGSDIESYLFGNG